MWCSVVVWLTARLAAERLVAEGQVKLMLERYALSKFSAALARHQEPYRARKVVLDHAK